MYLRVTERRNRDGSTVAKADAAAGTASTTGATAAVVEADRAARIVEGAADGKAVGDTTTLADPAVVARLKSEYGDRE